MAASCPGAQLRAPRCVERVSSRAAFMDDAKKLKKFHVEGAGDIFSLHIEDEAGGMLELSASREQVDLIADSLDELLSQTEEADEVEGGDEKDDDEE